MVSGSMLLVQLRLLYRKYGAVSSRDQQLEDWSRALYNGLNFGFALNGIVLAVNFKQIMLDQAPVNCTFVSFLLGFILKILSCFSY